MKTQREDDDADKADRWLISYADLITLLFAVFVVLYAYSQVNEGKYKALSESLGEAFGRSGGGLLPAAGRVVGNQPAPTAIDPRVAQRIALRHRTAAGMRDALKGMLEEDKVRITETPDGVVIDFTASALFDTGVAEPSAEARAAVRAAASLVAATEYLVTVEGHSDDTPISNRVFASNWELSAARAAAVARLFEAEGVSGQRLTAQGFGPNRPIANNDNAEGRARNRRVMAILKEPPTPPI
ncbi:MAG: flagellar motor protein MotD [Betaproteobacteria bacterium]|nr:flagellar motor protein MotD [Betaproteobacteria bacterium]